MNDLIDRLQNAIADRYVIQREVGRGGMANVYLAHDVRHDRAVAVKVLRPELGVLLGAERFLREIRVVARLQHPHILPVHDSGEVEGALFYVMPYVEGASLRERLRKEHWLPIGEAVRIACDVAGALDLAHRRGVIHRDIKPGNILFVDGHAVVADFGIARAVHAAGGEMWETITDSGVALGTPAYMSPEQAVGAATLDARADIYSLGCVLYEMLVGEPPFIGPGGEVLVAKRFTEDPPVVSTIRGDVPPEVDAAVAKALARAPEDRFSLARDLMDTLTPAATTQPNAIQQPVTSGRSRAVALAVASVMVAVAALFVWLGRRAEDAQTSAATDTAASLAVQPPAVVAPAAPALPSPPANRDSASPPAASQAGKDEPRATPKGTGAGDRPSGAPTERAPAAGSANDPVRLANVFQSAFQAARGVRQRAVLVGALPAEFARADSIGDEAIAAAINGRWREAMRGVSEMEARYAEVERTASARRTADSQAPRVAPAQIPPQPPPARAEPTRELPPTPPADPRADISAVLARYARALESRSVANVQAAYPGMTAAQRRSWDQFFQNVQDMRATLTIGDLDVKGDVAEARVTGEYQYASGSARRAERQPVVFHATFRREGASWRLTSVSQ